MVQLAGLAGLTAGVLVVGVMGAAALTAAGVRLGTMRGDGAVVGGAAVGKGGVVGVDVGSGDPPHAAISRLINKLAAN